MMSVEIKVNGKLIHRLTARRVTDSHATIYRYDTDMGVSIYHKYADGILVLAEKLIGEKKKLTED